MSGSAARAAGIDWQAGRGHMLAAGKSLEWASFGHHDPAQRVIVLLHEGLGSIALWRDFPERLAATTGWAVFAYARAGYGDSEAADLPRPLDYMTREAVEVLPDVLDAIGAGEYILLGHSDGATIAAEYVGRVSDVRVRALVLMAPHFFTEPMGLAEIRRARELFAEQDLGKRMAKYHCDPEATFRGWNDAWLAPGFESWNVAGVIDHFRIPALVMQGKDDQYGTIAQVQAVEDRSQAPVEVAMLDDCRHSPFIEQPAVTLATVASFLERLERFDPVTADRA